MTAAPQVLQVCQANGVWTFTLSRPDKRNALNAPLVEDLLEAVSQAHAAGARLLVFSGAGSSFCAGFDLSELETQSEGDLLLRFVRIEMLLQAIAQSPAQTLALAHGKVFGAGVDLFAACRHRVAAPDAVFRMPGLQFGLVLGTRRFGEIVGAQAARELLERLGSFDADRALAMRFATRLASSGQWPALVEEMQSQVRLLDPETQAALGQVLHPGRADEDLASLTRSAARPGLKQRLQRYLGQQA